MHLWSDLSATSSCFNSISDSRTVLTTRLPACTLDNWGDQKLIDLEWPNNYYCEGVFLYNLVLAMSVHAMGMY